MNHLWQQWFTKHHDFTDSVSSDYPRLNISCPFISIDSDWSRTNHKLMYVGKATHRGWYDDEYKVASALSVEALIREREAKNRNAVLNEIINSGFWAAFRAMSNALGYISEQHPHPIWSNIAKIGVPFGNPTGSDWSFQSELATETLRAEIETYQPSIVAFVTSDYQSLTVLQATNTKEADWRKSGDCRYLNKIDAELWWIPRNAMLGSPAYLWSNHPGRISVSRRNLWASCALALSLGQSDLSSVAGRHL